YCRQHFRQPIILGKLSQCLRRARPIIVAVDCTKPIGEKLLGLPASRNFCDRAQYFRAPYTTQFPPGPDHILTVTRYPFLFLLSFIFLKEIEYIIDRLQLFFNTSDFTKNRLISKSIRAFLRNGKSRPFKVLISEARFSIPCWRRMNSCMPQGLQTR